MEMRNCPRCKKLFTYTGMPICPDCVPEDETVFEAVRVYIKDHPENSLAVVAKDTGVSVKKILRYIKEGRLEISHGMRGEIVCENCGAPITKGKYCDKCVIEINQQVDDMFAKGEVPLKAKEPEKKSDGSRMYTRISEKKR
jgi:flagellar operon protein (TIGR03826 family)